MSSLAKVYATAFFEVTESEGKTSENLQTLLTFGKALKGDQEVFAILASPLISDGDKESLVKEALKPGLTAELENFFKILIKNKRLSFILEVIKFFEKMSAKSNFISGFVDSAIELTEKEKDEIKKTVEKKLSQTVKLQFRLNPDLIGGLEVRVGDHLFEDSILSHIKRLESFVAGSEK